MSSPGELPGEPQGAPRWFTLRVLLLGGSARHPTLEPRSFRSFSVAAQRSRNP